MNFDFSGKNVKCSCLCHSADDIMHQPWDLTGRQFQHVLSCWYLFYHNPTNNSRYQASVFKLSHHQYQFMG